MKKLVLAASALALALLPSAPAFADWHGHGGHGGYYGRSGYRGGVGLSFNFGYPYYPRYYGYPAYYGPYYYAPPPTVVYEPVPAYAPPSQTVVYTQAPTVSADQTSPTYTDGQGRTCREYQSTGQVGGGPASAYGTACLQPDGSWRIVN